MNLRPHKARSVDINMTPLIDVVFLMLIFFMVSTTFDRSSRIQLELPEAGQARQEQKEERQISIVIDAEGNFYLDDEQLVNNGFATLKRALEKRVQGLQSLPPLAIVADARTSHQRVMTAMDAASQVGLVNMSFPARQREP
ncbi:MAG: biopolymer transporter ExbD [Gammaproteobacteria bacterium SHHR-1]|uniref:ExbD/TolR family protein n=1 Tax=Magnetovirga frankeli TaxID=947516 RepID=UPI00129331F2|nr:biopolymer transporter ExbD [gamma proteobacterium SS-5]